MEQKYGLFGLIGIPLGHSWSADYFNDKFKKEGLPNKEYRLFPLTSLDKFPALIRNYPQLAGLNVTIPYKEKIIPYLDEMDETAQQIGAVNTIKIIRKNGMNWTKGFNTDADGFYLTLKDQVKYDNALIIGNGGASKAVAFALKKLGVRYTFVSRTKRGPDIIPYIELTIDIIKHNELIINTTPLGMYPDIDQLPQIPYLGLTPDHLCYDLIYNPEETGFIKQGKAMNSRTMNGKQMLLNQAELAYEIFMTQEGFTASHPDHYPSPPQLSS